jgi:hypothetical protein
VKPFAKWLLMLSSLVTAVTGVVYFALERFYVPVDEFAIGHPLEPWLLKAHILAAPALVFAIGLITLDHIWKHYRCLVPAGRKTGLAAMWVIIPMIVTGYLIQAVTAVAWLEALGWLHLGTGLAYLGSLIAHQRVFRGTIPTVVAKVAPTARRLTGQSLPQTRRGRARATAASEARRP